MHIYSVYNSDVMYKRGKDIYKYLFKKKKKKSLVLKTTEIEKDIQIFFKKKNLSLDKVKCGQ